MQGGLLFWMIAAAVVAGCGAGIFAPLFRGGGRAERRASYDLQVHRDQLREVEADLARGTLSAEEAAATRIEVSRRLLAAADTAEVEQANAAAPRRVSRTVAAAATAALALAAFALYGWLGGDGRPDAPLAPRLAEAAAERAARPSQAEAEATVAARGDAPPPVAARAQDLELIDRLQAALKTRPDDLQGHRLLAQSLAGLGNWAPARAAQAQVVTLLGDKATARDLVDLAELSILAAGGYVSPEAEAALSRALVLDPRDQVGRYYSALTLMQGGRPDLAYRIWSGLVDEGPADAPWMEGAQAGAAEAARQAGIAPPAGGAGPTAADVDAAQALPAEQRQAMIEGMVTQLSERLATQGGPPADWAQLIRSLGVLGRRDEAAAILAEARQKNAGDAAGLALIEAAGRDAGLAP